MKTFLVKSRSRFTLACLIVGASAVASYGQLITHSISTFNSKADVDAWSVAWGTPTATYLAGDYPPVPAGGSKGCMVWTASYGPSSAGPGGIQIGLNGLNASSYTALEMDVKVDPSSALDEYGNAAWFQGAFDYSANWTWDASPGFNLAPVATNNGWMHVIWPLSSFSGGPPAGTNLNDIMAFVIDPYDGNFTNTGTVLIRIDNIMLTAPSPTYANYVPPALQFNDSNSVAAIWGADNAITGVTTSWYGTTNYVTWSTNDSKGNTNSGSLYISAQFESGNNALVMVIPFDTNWTVWSAETNASDVIDAFKYSGVELDVLWDTNNSTIGIDMFNGTGDVDGFPIGSADTNGYYVNEICGSATTGIPDAASNSWQHIKCPFVNIQPNDKNMMGVFIKKYVGGMGTNGTVAFWVDNITYTGAVIPTHPNQATLSIARPVPGLQCNFTGTAGNPAYDREMICTANNTYSFVDASGPVTYSITFGATGNTNDSSGQILFDQNNSETEPDWVDPSVFRFVIQANGTGGSSLTLQCKTNTANANGDLYDSSDPAWNGTDATHTNSSPAVGKWTFTVSNNTNFLCTAPNGATTNLSFPLGFQSADVEANFPTNAGMYVYFGAMGGGATAEGKRWVVSQCSVSGGGVTPLSENWVAEANTGSVANGGEAGPAGSGGNTIPGQGVGWTGTVGGVSWNDTSDSKTGYGIYLLGTNTAFVLNWTDNAGPGLTVLTNTTLAASGWGTNTALTADSYLDATYYTSEVDVSNLTSGDLFFKLVNP
ncbi:MAG: hypothetical protein ABSG59_14545 [Verrucomicrobiota bacterium]|jgi:hypothetical protein